MNLRAISALVAMLLVGCGAGGKVCAVIDLAAQACTVVRYLDDDGKPKEVRVTPEEAKTWAKAMAAKHAAAEALDAGAEGGAK